METPLWQPTAERIAGTALEHFRLAASRVAGHALPDYQALWQWSIDHPAAFWSMVWDDGQLTGDKGAVSLMQPDAMPGARWKTAYAQHQRGQGLGVCRLERDERLHGG